MAIYKLSVKISLMIFINKKINIVILKNCILPISHNLDNYNYYSYDNNYVLMICQILFPVKLTDTTRTHMNNKIMEINYYAVIIMQYSFLCIEINL